jgi:predicted RNA binding protein YcfA (HicA-like mRNA interferase family)
MSILDKGTWERIKSVTVDELIKALLKDGFLRVNKCGSHIGFYIPDGRWVIIHYHPKKTYSHRILKKLLKDVGWNKEDLIRLGLI